VGLLKAFTHPEYRYDMLGRFDYLLHRRRYRALLGETATLVEKSFVLALEDACEYLQIDVEQFFLLADSWPAMERELFDQTGKGEDFYRSWNDEYARANLCANVVSQHSDRINYSILSGIITNKLAPEGPWVDYGCGTASLTIAMVLAGVITQPVRLIEMDNG